jgi:purine nucleosidase
LIVRNSERICRFYTHTGMQKFLLLFAFLSQLFLAARADLLLQPNDRVAICGGGDYSIYLEDYLYGSQAVPGLEVEAFDNIGNPSGVIDSLNNGGLGFFKPTVVVIAFGGTADMAAALKKAGVRVVMVNAPSNAATDGMVGANADGATSAATARAKTLFGDPYAAQAGWPDALNLAAASAYIKAFGYDGNLGVLTADFAASTADGGPDQKIVSFKDNTLMVQSTRIPFWFPGHGVGGSDPPPWPALKALPFEQDLNRYMLIVKNLPTTKTKIYWGDDNMDFSSADLAKGVNLEESIPGFGNPFGNASSGIDNGVGSQRNVERLSNWAPDAASVAKRDDARQLIKSRVTPLTSKIVIVPLAPVAAQPPGPIPVILDTDLDGDVDDVGALALLDNFTDQGEANLLAVVHNTVNVNKSSCGTIKAIDAWYFHPDIPIGQYLGEHPTATMTSKVDPAPPGTGAYHDPPIGSGSSYTQQVRQRFEPNFPDDDKMPSGVDVYRKALASAPDGQVVICSVGMMHNIQDLMLSEPDSVSPLSGMDLIKKKVRQMVIMANTQPADLYVLTHWPTPILWTCDVGSGIGTGPSLLPTPENNPVRMCYDLFGVLHSGRQSWDLTAAWLAVRGPGDMFDVISGRPQYITDIIHDPAKDHPNESVVTIKMPFDQASKVIGTELARPPKQ